MMYVKVNKMYIVYFNILQLALNKTQGSERKENITTPTGSYFLGSFLKLDMGTVLSPRTNFPSEFIFAQSLSPTCKLWNSQEDLQNRTK